MEYKYEDELVHHFQLEIIFNNFLNISNHAQEFKYNGGRADIIASNTKGEILVFEAKLSNWQKALNQAFRGTSFAHYAFVIMPIEKIKNIIKHKDNFEKLGVGLCCLTEEGIQIIITAKKYKPILPWVTSDAEDFLKGDNLCMKVQN